MRVLHINSGNLYGGVESFLVTLARERHAAPTMRSEFGVCFDGRLSGELETAGSTVHRVGAVRLSRPHTLFRARAVLKALLRQEQFDAVVCHQPWACVVFGPVVRAAGFPLILWLHMAGDGRNWLDRLARRTRPDLVICNSRFTADCTEQWLRAARTQVVYCPVSLPASKHAPERRTSIRESLDTPPDDVVIVQVSRLEAWKGQRVLLEALTGLRDVPGWTCWIVGGAQRPAETDYLSDLNAIAQHGGIAHRVRFLGERRDVPDVLAGADIFCQPNTSPEPFGLSLVEALHAGLPVVTSGIGGACEIVNESCGLLTRRADVSSVRTALSRLLFDGELRAALARGARVRPAVICDPVRQLPRIEQALASAATTSLEASLHAV